jgi:hypothetical protein
MAEIMYRKAITESAQKLAEIKVKKKSTECIVIKEKEFVKTVKAKGGGRWLKQIVAKELETNEQNIYLATLYQKHLESNYTDEKKLYFMIVDYLRRLEEKDSILLREVKQQLKQLIQLVTDKSLDSVVIEEATTREFSEWFKGLLKTKNLTEVELSARYGIFYGTLLNWSRERSVPSKKHIDKLKKICYNEKYKEFDWSLLSRTVFNVKRLD